MLKEIFAEITSEAGKRINIKNILVTNVKKTKVKRQEAIVTVNLPLIAK